MQKSYDRCTEWRECLLYTEGEQQPQLLLIQTLGAQERGRGSGARKNCRLYCC